MLWLIRHAEVERRYQGIFGGQIDMDLSPRGHEQAAALAAYLHHHRFEALYASPMKRVQQTLAPARLNGIPTPTILPGLKEVDFGEWTGLSWDQVQEKFGVGATSWLTQLEAGTIAGAESAAALQARLEPCLRQILAGHPGQRVAVVCHGGVIRMLLAMLLGWPLSRLAAFEVEYASITQVVWRGQEARLHLLNFAPWRDCGNG